MDDLLTSMSQSFEITKGSGLSSTNEHPRFSAYKNRAKPELSQERRRSLLMQRQKDSRFDRANKARNLAMDEFDDNDISGFEFDQAVEEMEYAQNDTKTTDKKPKRNYYKDQLMLSEWMVEKPDNFENDWIMVVCPQGRRCLVVASKGVTTVYSKGGQRLNSFKSHLHGSGKHEGYTLLDCIQSEIDHTYYVIDMLCWNSNPILDSDTEFRFFWAMSNISENPHLAEVSRSNPYAFKVLPRSDCSTESIKKLLASELPFKAPLDGMLFYLKSAVYWQDTTPLVTWLKPFMLPEILHIDIPESMKCEKSVKCEKSAAEFRQEFTEKRDAKNKKKLGNHVEGLLT